MQVEKCIPIDVKLIKENGKEKRKKRIAAAEPEETRLIKTESAPTSIDTKPPRTVIVASKRGESSIFDPISASFRLLMGTTNSSSSMNSISLAINTLLLLACLDFQVSPQYGRAHDDLAFARVGAVTDTWVKIVARIPPLSLADSDHPQLDNTTAVSISSARLLYRLTQPAGSWADAGSLVTEADNDHMIAVKIDGLLPSSTYSYRFTLPDTATPHPHLPKTLNFTTFPDPQLASDPIAGGSVFKFASTGWSAESSSIVVFG